MKMLFILLLASFPLFASDLASEYFEKAGRFYEKGDYDSALVFYGKILDMGLNDGRVYYNMGNVFYRKKELGRAILHYELAYKLDPSDNDIRANLQFAYASTVDKIQKTKASFFFRVISSLHGLFSLRTEAWLFMALLYLLCGCFIYSLFAHPRFKRPAGFACAFLLLFLALVSLSFFIKMDTEKNVREAVGLSQKIDVRNEPDGAQVLFSVHEGAKFTLLRKVGEWYLGSLPNGLSGWVQAGDLGLIEISD